MVVVPLAAKTAMMQTSATHQSAIESHVIRIIAMLKFSNSVYDL
jgi:hypothetical protein